VEDDGTKESIKDPVALSMFQGSRNFVAVAIATCVSYGCGDETFVLYRNSVLDENMRIHVATFDSTDGGAYNRENCEVAQSLFQGQPGVKVKYWCEKGRFRK